MVEGGGLVGILGAGQLVIDGMFVDGQLVGAGILG